jgi:ABC-2 type transport system ATP-binding protein
MNDLIVIENLTKTYENIKAINNLSFSVKKGEIFGLLGPNGAGKSTTISSIVGLLMPSMGKITIDGINISENPLEAKKRIGYVSDSANVIEKLTAVEYITFFGQLNKVAKKVIAERTKLLLSLFDIYSRRFDLIETFSFGMKKKVQIAAALVHSPKLLIIDEPFSALDPEMVAILKNFLKKLPELGISILVATHDLFSAEQVCTKVALINKGKLVAIGDIGSLLKKNQAHNLENAYLKLIDSKAKKEQIEKVVVSWRGFEE